ncbi:MAG: methyltransferase domain-containing protein [Candidatus Paceibacterota bacterium]
MVDLSTKIKLSFVPGLEEVVLAELKDKVNGDIYKKKSGSIYLDQVDNLVTLKGLRSVSRVYVVLEGEKLNPYYISKHKSVLGNLIEKVLRESGEGFKTFKITCAGSDSSEVRAIADYVERTFGLSEEDDADMKVQIIKVGEVWEVGVQITPRPLSVRDYKVRNMEGAMDPTVAYALNSLVLSDSVGSYLNVFSGSATLLIEAGLCFPNIENLIGFDNKKEHISLAIQNIKKAGLIKRVELKEKDIFDRPDLGKFDVITSDLPFGMYISKNEDLKELYRSFVDHSQASLNASGEMAVYTSKGDIFTEALSGSGFSVVKKMKLKMVTSVDAYMSPEIFVCELI